MDYQFWTFVNSFASWLSAAATVAAVVTALYLARRGDRIRLRVRCGIRIVIAQGDARGQRPEYVNPRGHERRPPHGDDQQSLVDGAVLSKEADGVGGATERAVETR